MGHQDRPAYQLAQFGPSFTFSTLIVLHCQYEKSHCKVDDCYDYECQSDRNGGVSGEPSPIHRSFLMPLKMDAGPCRLPIWCGNRFPSSKGSGERWTPELKLTATPSR